MENAHLRFGLLEYVRMTEKASTRIRLRVDRYIGEDRQAHLLSVFGNDSDVGAITAAVHEKAAFSLTFPNGETKDVTLGEHASCYKGAVNRDLFRVDRDRGDTRFLGDSLRSRPGGLLDLPAREIELEPPDFPSLKNTHRLLLSSVFQPSARQAPNAK